MAVVLQSIATSRTFTIRCHDSRYAFGGIHDWGESSHVYTWYVPQPPSVDGPEAVYYYLSSKQDHWIFLSERLCAFGPMHEADMPLPSQ